MWPAGYAQFLPSTKPSATDGGLSSVDIAVKTSLDHDGSATTTALPIWAANDGETVALGDLLKSASVDFKGDFSVGAFHMGTTSAVLLDPVRQGDQDDRRRRQGVLGRGPGRSRVRPDHHDRVRGARSRRTSRTTPRASRRVATRPPWR